MQSVTTDLDTLENKRISYPYQEPKHSASGVLFKSSYRLSYSVQIMIIMMIILIEITLILISY